MLYIRVNSFRSKYNIKEINNYKKLIKSLLLETYTFLLGEIYFKNLASKEAFVNVIITNDIQMQKFNKKYRNINTPTNVVSLQFEEKDNIILGKIPKVFHLGDIFLSLDTITKEAYEEGIDFIEHLSRVVIHGYLHLLGFDHYDKITSIDMKNFEDKILQYCKINTNSIIRY